jgi:hypothetical protein
MKMKTLMTYCCAPCNASESHDEHTRYDEGFEVVRFDSDTKDYHISVHDVDEVTLSEQDKLSDGSTHQTIKIKQGDNIIEIVLFFNN